MKTFYSIIVGLLLCIFATVIPTLADELKINIGVESGERTTQVLAADIYALVDGKLTEITVAPDDMAFKLNLKAGAARVKGFWFTNAKQNKVSK